MFVYTRMHNWFSERLGFAIDTLAACFVFILSCFINTLQTFDLLLRTYYCTKVRY